MALAGRIEAVGLVSRSIPAEAAGTVEVVVERSGWVGTCSLVAQPDYCRCTVVAGV